MNLVILQILYKEWNIAPHNKNEVNIHLRAPRVPTCEWRARRLWGDRLWNHFCRQTELEASYWLSSFSGKSSWGQVRVEAVVRGRGGPRTGLHVRLRGGHLQQLARHAPALQGLARRAAAVLHAAPRVLGPAPSRILSAYSSGRAH